MLTFRKINWQMAIANSTMIYNISYRGFDNFQPFLSKTFFFLNAIIWVGFIY